MSTLRWSMPLRTPVADGPLGEQRRPAPADVLEHRRPTRARSGTCRAARRTTPSAGPPPSRSIGRRSRRAHRARERPADRRRHIVGDRDLFERSADLLAEPAHRIRGRPRPHATAGRGGHRSSAPRPGPVGTLRSSHRTRRARRTPSIRASSPRCAPLPPTAAICVRSTSWKPSTNLLIRSPLLHRRATGVVAWLTAGYRATIGVLAASPPPRDTSGPAGESRGAPAPPMGRRRAA